MAAVLMTPITYGANVMVRFADFDPYGHVNATNYLDYGRVALLHEVRRAFLTLAELERDGRVSYAWIAAQCEGSLDRA